MGPGDSSLEAYASLGDDRNKPKNRDVSEDTQQGIVSEKVSELTLDMEDKDILILVEKWEKAWKDSPKKQEWEKQIDENEKYWLGNQHDLPRSDKSRARVDNLIFEALETYLPQATRRNPDPIVSLDTTEKSEEGNEDPVKTAYVEKVKNRLADLADKNRLRLKLKKGARHWAIYQLGVAKFGWDLDQDIPVVRIVRPKRIILDPDATIDEDGYNGNRVGEYRKLDAERIKAIIKDEPTSAEGIKKIDEMVDGKTGTEIQFIEWWVNEYMCWTLGKTVLLKKKNPHWNYDKTENPDPTNISDPNVQVDEFGTATAVPVKIPGINHFASPKMPYTFLSVFNLGDQPMDKTSLIGQNLSNQDKINKRNKQIDKNADRMNGGMVVSLERSGLTQGQAKNVSEALRKGGVVTIPTGSPREAIDQYSPSGLPADVFNDLVDTRSRLRDIFGVAGSSAAGIKDYLSCN